MIHVVFENSKICIYIILIVKLTELYKQFKIAISGDVSSEPKKFSIWIFHWYIFWAVCTYLATDIEVIAAAVSVQESIFDA